MFSKLTFRRQISLLAFFVLTNCANNITQFGKITPYNSTTKENKAFVFTVEESYARAHLKSKQDEKNPLMTKAEADLLKKLLVRQKYCINQSNELSFKITSKQEKIYDVTFASLIEQNYNAKPAAPRMYYGNCI